jgi:hypothetical protein
MSIPRAAEVTPLKSDFPDMLATTEKAKTTRPKISGGPILKAIFARGGEKKVSPTSPIVPATKEEIAAMARAGAALPCLAISYPSTQVITEEISPGIFIKIEVVDPPYMAP